MNKKNLLEYIQTLPDNLEVLPISLADVKQERVGDTNFAGLTGVTFRAEYEEEHLNMVTLTLKFRTKVKFESHRNDDGTLNIANSRLIKP
jgi:hypothetical protein